MTTFILSHHAIIAYSTVLHCDNKTTVGCQVQSVKLNHIGQ